jgi:hypothetical protein
MQKPNTREGRVQLIDLAGSEDNKKTGNSGQQMVESTKINTSLFTLGKVITALNTGINSKHIFRESKLTRLLKDSLGSNSHTVMVSEIFYFPKAKAVQEMFIISYCILPSRLQMSAHRWNISWTHITL